MPAYGTPINGATLEQLAAAELEWRGGRYKAPPPEVGILFRVEAVSYSFVINPDYDEYGSTVPRLELFGYEVERFTPLGATLKHVWGGSRRKWVNLQPGAKQWASTTAIEAVRQFHRRREGQVHILRRQLRRAKFERDLAYSIIPQETTT